MIGCLPIYAYGLVFLFSADCFFCVGVCLFTRTYADEVHWLCSLREQEERELTFTITVIQHAGKIAFTCPCLDYYHTGIPCLHILRVVPRECWHMLVHPAHRMQNMVSAYDAPLPNISLCDSDIHALSQALQLHPNHLSNIENAELCSAHANKRGNPGQRRRTGH